MHVKQILGGRPTQPIPGTVMAIIDNLEFDATACWDPKILFVAGNIYAIAYQDLADNLVIVTVDITPDGLIGTAVIDTAIVAAIQTQDVDFIHISANVYAVVYCGAGRDGYISTITINADGTIGAVIDTQAYFVSGVSYIQYPRIIHVSGDIYAIIHRGSGIVDPPPRGAVISTVDIDVDGNIVPGAIDSLSIDTAAGGALDPTIIHISGNVYAAVYTDGSIDGWVRTFDIDALGNIGAMVISSLEFAPVRGNTPEIIHVVGTTYAIAFRGPDSDGWLITVDIDNAGNINPVIVDSFEFDYTYGSSPTIVNISGDLFAIFYYSNTRGLIATVTIDAAGTIAGVRWRAGSGINDTSFRFNATYGGRNDVIAITTNIYAIAYKGPASGQSGQITTVKVS